MKLLMWKQRIAKLAATAMIVFALIALGATFMPSVALAGSSKDECITGLCCTKGYSWKCLWIGNWVFKYNPITMKCC